ncbi:aminotransferase class I/II-fold pyridoxal phosphate-dependent enzyme [Achromobacter sp. SD115]|uniref:MocR-like pyridoxine biosynthesis transcription factor PdxR n=1 Tax=Achromobacter sp. SD115 TaxID=2782011 RepID=UPI001A97C001|nr:aminotransferase class I/II-fold pyridoxal phosphate-dependent enzyme [Achromobacter sp. SD115]MBO1012076.1 aminotransferase class I/II-fold pyridoxal phosphate-dependent enzyme [Achromobacter sp. SD115]
MSKPLSARPGAKRQEASLDLPMDAARPGESKQTWVYREIRERILKGALPSGARLPSTRSLAGRWHIARSTVEAAYDQLRSEGYTAGTVGSGTYVAAVIPDNFFREGLPGEQAATRKARAPLTAAQARAAPPAPVPNATQSAPAPNAAPPEPAADAARPASHMATLFAPPQPNSMFFSRSADAALFPMERWRKGLMASARRVTPAQLANDEPQGWRPLREQIARYLGAARGISCDPDQVIVLSGIRDGLDLCGHLLLRPQDRVLIEDPGYLNAEPIFGQYTRHIVPLAIDAEGFPVEQAKLQRGVKLVHVTPAHQSPTGSTMSVSRRLELLDWAAQSDCWIVEDDYDSEFSYDGAPLAALKSLDTADRVIHCGSFNKTLFNALRIGYAVVPRELAPAFVQARRRAGRSPSIIEQMTLAAFLQDGSFARHVRKARGVYARRRDAALRALRQAVGSDELRISGEHAGFHLLWWLPPGWDMAQAVAAARTAGVGMQPVADFCRKVDLPPGVVVGYSAVEEEALLKLGTLLRQAAASQGPLQDPALLRRLLRVKDRMDAASHEAWPVERLAEVSGISKAHFAHSFKRAFGLPPHRYLLTRRIEQSVALLRDTEQSVTEIAYATGWESLGTYSRIFRDVTGLSPSAMRAQARTDMQPLDRMPACVVKAAQRPDLNIAVLEKRRREADGKFPPSTQEVL